MTAAHAASPSSGARPVHVPGGSRSASGQRQRGAPNDAPKADGRGEASGLAVEATAIGIQTLVPGVTPISLSDRLAFRAAAPLAPKKPQRACDLGLFDMNARNQLDLFQIKEA